MWFPPLPKRREFYPPLLHFGCDCDKTRLFHLEIHSASAITLFWVRCLSLLGTYLVNFKRRRACGCSGTFLSVLETSFCRNNVIWVLYNVISSLWVWIILILHPGCRCSLSLFAEGTYLALWMVQGTSITLQKRRVLSFLFAKTIDEGYLFIAASMIPSSITNNLNFLCDHGLCHLFLTDSLLPYLCGSGLQVYPALYIFCGIQTPFPHSVVLC